MEAPQDAPGPDDAEIDLVMRQARQAMERAGLAAQDLIDALPAAGNELMRQWYGDAFVDELEREYAAARCGAGAP